MKVKIQLVISLVFITLITYSQSVDFLSESIPEVKIESSVVTQEAAASNIVETVKENDKELKEESKLENIESDSTTNTTPIPVEPEKNNEDNTNTNSTVDNKTITTNTDNNEKVEKNEKTEAIPFPETNKTDLNETQKEVIKEEPALIANEIKEVKVETSEINVPSPKEEVKDIKEIKDVKDNKIEVKEDLKEIKESPEADYADDIGIYSFLAVVFIASMAYMIFLIYTQNQKYDFLNYDLNREMNYQLIPDEN